MIIVDIDSKNLLKSLHNFPVRVQKNVLVGAVRAATKPIVDDARRRVPVRSGQLKKSIGTTRRRTKNRNIVRFSVSPRKKGKNSGWYGHFIEFGTSKMPAKPFMRPAFDSQDKESINAAKVYMEKRIDKEVIKARS